MDWRERYEVEARKASEALAPLGEAELLDRIRAGRIDPYFAIWRAIGREGTPANAALPLWTFLRDHPGDAQMLNRYHCAAALFRILGMDDPASENELRKRVQWDHEGEDARQAALLELLEVILERLSPPRQSEGPRQRQTGPEPQRAPRLEGPIVTSSPVGPFLSFHTSIEPAVGARSARPVAARGPPPASTLRLGPGWGRRPSGNAGWRHRPHLPTIRKRERAARSGRPGAAD